MKHSDVKYDAKYPMVLPGKHPVTELVIRHYHHLDGAYRVLAEIRQRFRTVKGVSSVKHVLSKCHVCRRYNATLGEQVTAQLSMVQVSSDSHRIIYSFAAVGLDILDRFTKEVGPKQVSSDSHRIIYSFAAVGLDILDRFTKEVGPRLRKCEIRRGSKPS